MVAMDLERQEEREERVELRRYGDEMEEGREGMEEWEAVDGDGWGGLLLLLLLFIVADSQCWLSGPSGVESA